MKNRSSKNSSRTATSVYPVQVAGTSRTCSCGTEVRRGIMWEFQSVLHCSRLCATEAERLATPSQEG